MGFSITMSLPRDYLTASPTMRLAANRTLIADRLIGKSQGQGENPSIYTKILLTAGSSCRSHFWHQN
ncbi:hypothetical protein XENTR_v10015421 [Xenopus tropicalis]|nr:hypothetical protein XENTR_v10015421 [Xenopus tropicalis]